MQNAKICEMQKNPIVIIAAAIMVFNRSVQIPDAVSNKLNSTIRGMIGYDSA